MRPKVSVSLKTDSPKEYFAHVSGLVDLIKDNDEVTFDLEEGKRGINAVNVEAFA